MASFELIVWLGSVELLLQIKVPDVQDADILTDSPWQIFTLDGATTTGLEASHFISIVSEDSDSNSEHLFAISFTV
jgi:hypothetical protein